MCVVQSCICACFRPVADRGCICDRARARACVCVCVCACVCTQVLTPPIPATCLTSGTCVMSSACLCACTHAGLDPTDPSNMPYFWHKGRDFIKQGTPVHLIYRMACVSDKKDVNAPRKTRELWKLGSKQVRALYTRIRRYTHRAAPVLSCPDLSPRWASPLSVCLLGPMESLKTVPRQCKYTNFCRVMFAVQVGPRFTHADKTGMCMTLTCLKSKFVAALPAFARATLGHA